MALDVYFELIVDWFKMALDIYFEFLIVIIRFPRTIIGTTMAQGQNIKPINTVYVLRLKYWAN